MGAMEDLRLPSSCDFILARVVRMMLSMRVRQRASFIGESSVAWR